MALGGRPKEQGGHKPLKISVDKFVAQALEKVDNKSQFIEKVVRPVLEQLDPGEASAFLWQIDVYISQQIIVATNNANFKQAQALSWLAGQLEDARKLCGIPPADFKTPAVTSVTAEETELDKAKAISMMKAFEPIVGQRFSKEEWAYVLDQNDGKKMLDKARALIQLKGTQALL